MMFRCYLAAMLCFFLIDVVLAAALPTEDRGCQHVSTAACDYTIYQSASGEERFNAIKLKRLGDVEIDLSSWNGSTLAEGETPSVNTGDTGVEFCLLAYDDLISGSDLRLHDYTITVNAPGGVQLWAFDGTRMPITLELYRDAAPASDRIAFVDGSASLRINSQGIAGNSCLNREYSIVAKVRAEDILEAGSSGPFFGLFSVQLQSHPIESSVPAVEQRFTVEINNLNTFVKVSGLDDVDLLPEGITGGWLTQQMDFCVFAMGATEYNLSLNSRNGTNHKFELENAGDKMTYQTSFKGTGINNWRPINHSNQTVTARGSQYLDCNGQKNATLRIELKNSDISKANPGVYSDVMEVTVAPR